MDSSDRSGVYDMFEAWGLINTNPGKFGQMRE